VSYVNAEIESHRSKSKACDKNITSILREVVKTVEERKKVAGVQLPLLKRAKKIFEHVVDVLEEAGVRIRNRLFAFTSNASLNCSRVLHKIASRCVRRIV